MNPGQSPKLLDQVTALMRVRRYALRTERTYCDWIRRYVKFHGMKSRAEVARVLDAVEADYALPLRLLYGSGLRLMEALRLRVVRPTPTPGPPASKGQGGDRLTGPNPGRALLSICVAFSCLLRLIP